MTLPKKISRMSLAILCVTRPLNAALVVKEKGCSEEK
jgi:hypothetical protein